MLLQRERTLLLTKGFEQRREDVLRFAVIGEAIGVVQFGLRMSMRTMAAMEKKKSRKQRKETGERSNGYQSKNTIQNRIQEKDNRKERRNDERTGPSDKLILSDWIHQNWNKKLFCRHQGDTSIQEECEHNDSCLHVHKN
jgi:hypothetical protein